MNLFGRRESDNVVVRRGMGGGAKAGLGIGGMIVVAIITLLMGGNATDVLQNTGLMSGSTQTQQGTYQPTKEEEELAKFSKQILASTEDIWTAEFQRMGKTYTPPKLVLYTGSIQTGCGNGDASTGPFYCSADQCIYLDLSFLATMKQQLGAGGDFANAYVIAHEVGHHVQYLLGTLDAAHQQMAQESEKESNRTSVRIELQADFYAGVWAYHEEERFKSLEAGDIEEALSTAGVIGDDHLQNKAQGYTVPDAFNHGTSEQRVKWLKKGLSTGNMDDGDTFSLPYSDL